MLGQPLQRGVEAVLVVVEDRGEPVRAGRSCRPAAAAPGRAGRRATPFRCRATSMAVPIGSRSCRQAVDQLLEPVDRAGELVAVLGQRVERRCCRSSINCSITWLLSASAFVNDDVLDNSDSSVPPWPCKIWTSDAVSALTSCGLRPWITGFSPPSSRSRSSAGAVRSTGICEPAGRILVDPRARRRVRGSGRRRG